jgi:catechol 2,3-dioxygenase-like lactoylglutathione lyase family enzyme
MLTDATPGATLPAADIARARGFYEGLGFEADEEYPDGSVIYLSGDAGFLVYPSEFAGTNKATAMSWMVDDFDAAKEFLEGQGITFMDFEINDEMKTVDGVLTDPSGGRASWFTDTEGNILSIGQR